MLRGVLSLTFCLTALVAAGDAFGARQGVAQPLTEEHPLRVEYDPATALALAKAGGIRSEGEHLELGGAELANGKPP